MDFSSINEFTHYRVTRSKGLKASATALLSASLMLTFISKIGAPKQPESRCLHAHG